MQRRQQRGGHRYSCGSAKVHAPSTHAHKPLVKLPKQPGAPDLTPSAAAVGGGVDAMADSVKKLHHLATWHPYPSAM